MEPQTALLLVDLVGLAVVMVALYRTASGSKAAGVRADTALAAALDATKAAQDSADAAAEANRIAQEALDTSKRALALQQAQADAATLTDVRVVKFVRNNGPDQGIYVKNFGLGIAEHVVVEWARIRRKGVTTVCPEIPALGGEEERRIPAGGDPGHVEPDEMPEWDEGRECVFRTAWSEGESHRNSAWERLRTE